MMNLMTRPCGTPLRRLRSEVERREPSLEELLAEPIVRALMKADGVDPQDVTALLRSSAE